MNVLDLFSGTGGWSQAFLDRGHDVLRIDNDERFMQVPWMSVEDVLEFRPRDAYDVVLASPPCQAFSLGAGGTHIAAFDDCSCGARYRKVHERWEHDWTDTTNINASHTRLGNERLAPVSEFGKLSIQLVSRTLELIGIIKPRFWWMENPNGGMIHFVRTSIPRVQVTYCGYGEPRMKLTNLWGDWPGSWTLANPDDWHDVKKNPWVNMSESGWHPRPRCQNGDSCHAEAKRGMKTGTQGLKNAIDRAIVPYQLSLEVCLACEEAAG